MDLYIRVFLEVISNTLFAINNDLKLNNQFSISHANVAKNINHASKIGAFDIVSDDCYARAIWWHWRKLVIDFFFIMIIVIFNLMIWFIPRRKKEYNDTLMLVTQSVDFIYLVRILLGPLITYISIYILHQFEGLLNWRPFPISSTLEITRIKRLLY